MNVKEIDLSEAIFGINEILDKVRYFSKKNNSSLVPISIFDEVRLKLVKKILEEYLNELKKGKTTS